MRGQHAREAGLAHARRTGERDDARVPHRGFEPGEVGVAADQHGRLQGRQGDCVRRGVGGGRDSALSSAGVPVKR